MPSLASLIKAYDVRGVVPDDLDEHVARALGAAFAHVVGVDDADHVPCLRRVVVGHDMRPSSPSLSRAFAEGVAAVGGDVVLIGLCSTDGLYYASGVLDAPGAMFTASHNPAQYNGIKLCRAGARPVGQDTGLVEVPMGATLREIWDWHLAGTTSPPSIARRTPTTLRACAASSTPSPGSICRSCSSHTRG